MNNELLSWNLGLLDASVCALMGLIGYLSLKDSKDRSLASGLLMQAVALFFVVASVRFEQRPSLRLGALVVAGFLIVRELNQFHSAGDDHSTEKEN